MIVGLLGGAKLVEKRAQVSFRLRLRLATKKIAGLTLHSGGKQGWANKDTTNYCSVSVIVLVVYFSAQKMYLPNFVFVQ